MVCTFLARTIGGRTKCLYPRRISTALLLLLLLIPCVSRAFAPDARGDRAETEEDSEVTIDVLDNDSDFDGDSLAIFSITERPANGSTEISDNTILYIPAADFFGLDRFTYAVSDGTGHFDTAHVTVTVNAVDDPPVVENDESNTAADSPVTLNVLANDRDPDGGELELTDIPAQPTTGTVSWTADGDVTYSFVFSPEAGFAFGDSDSFTVRVSSDSGETAESTVAIRIDPPQDTAVDSDGDAIPDLWEIEAGLDPLDPDNPNDSDADEDGLPASFEYRTGTDPHTNDSDGNGIPDGNEDADGDGLSNRNELAAGTLPDNPDSDGDGYTDDVETLTADSDGDGTLDALDTDSDDDGLPDADELTAGTERTLADTDGDGLPDGAEDLDGDGRIAGDTNGDGIWQHNEQWTETSPLLSDTDGDGLPDGAIEESNPFVQAFDSDDDGIRNTDEVAAGTDVLNAFSRPGFSNLALANPGLSAADDYAQFSFAGQSGAFTVQCWVRTVDNDGWLMASRNGEFVLGLAAGLPEVTLSDGTSATGTTTVADGGWHHIAVAADPVYGWGRLYVDGALELEVVGIDTGVSLPNDTYRLTNGWSADASELLNGELDDLSATDYVLSQPAVQKLASAGPLLPVTHSSGDTVLAYSFDDGGLKAENLATDDREDGEAVLSGTVSMRGNRDEWEFTIGLSSAQVDAVSFGMQTAATANLDAGLDWRNPLPSPADGINAVAFETDDGEAAIREFQGVSPSAAWSLTVTVAANQTCVLAWDPFMVPASLLTIKEVDAAGVPVPTAAGIPASMAGLSQIERSADETAATHYFQISYPAFRLHLDPGWNLTSVPLQPSRSVAKIFESIPQVDAANALEWDGATYAKATVLTPAQGYWIYNSGAPVVVPVEGTPVATTVRSLSAGWQLVGPAGLPAWKALPLPLSSAPAGAISDPVWEYDGRSGLYRQPDLLLPGSAYWIHLSVDADVDLGP